MSPSFEHLSIPERLELIGQIWDTIVDADDTAATPIPDWHLKELDKRLASADAHPEAAISWEEVKARLTRKP
jgi:putative addiction module component (TIGR02574 family)